MKIKSVQSEDDILYAREARTKLSVIICSLKQSKLEFDL